jgi:hypothetical protein
MLDLDQTRPAFTEGSLDPLLRFVGADLEELDWSVSDMCVYKLWNQLTLGTMPPWQTGLRVFSIRWNRHQNTCKDNGSHLRFLDVKLAGVRGYAGTPSVVKSNRGIAIRVTSPLAGVNTETTC